MTHLSDHERELFVKALEGALGPQEREAWERLLAARPDVREEYAAQHTLKEVAMKLKFTKPPEETWDRYWADVYARIERGLAWLLISIGGAVVLGYAVYSGLMELLNNAMLPLVVRIAGALLMFGLAILVVSVLREKWFTHKSDKYREVIR